MSSREEILKVKSFLANKVVISNDSKITKILLKSQNQTIALPAKFAVSQSEFQQFKNSN